MSKKHYLWLYRHHYNDVDVENGMMQAWGEDSELATHHYYRNLSCGGQKGLTEAVFATVSDERSRLIVALT
jgi:spore maturation protein SpmB